jgi:hypothetical protein
LDLDKEIIDNKRNEEKVDGRNVKMICSVFGEKKKIVKWINGGVEINGGR